jgi:hypothetical protein
MSSIVRVYNIFTQIQSNFDNNKPILGQDLLKNVFNIESDDDLYYLKPYIVQEIDNCETEMRNINLGDDEISPVIPVFKKYIQESFFEVLRNFPQNIIQINKDNIDSHIYHNFVKNKFPKDALRLITRDARPLQKNFDNGYNEQIVQIKNDVQSLREELQKLNKQNDYVYDFILINLDRIDILLDNFDKIRPMYTQFNLYAIISPVYTISEYAEYREAVKLLFDKTVNFINNYGGCGMVVYEIYDKILPLL